MTGQGRIRAAMVFVIAVAAIVAAAPRASAGCGEGPWSAQELKTAADRLVQLVGQERANHGLPPLTVHVRIAQVAGEHSQRMANDGRIYHNDAYFGMHDELNASMLGENVAMGCDADGRHRALMDSPPHRANILNGKFTHLGVGARSDSSGWLYVTEGFAAVRAPAPAPVAQAPVAPAPAPPVSQAPTAPPATPQATVQPTAVPTPVVTPASPETSELGIGSGSFERLEASGEVPNTEGSTADRGPVGVVAPAALLAAIGFGLTVRPKRTRMPVPADRLAARRAATGSRTAADEGTPPASLVQRPDGRIVQVRPEPALKTPVGARR